MATKITMPKLGLTMSSGSVREWKKNAGDTVKKGEILFSATAGKLTFDVESPADGVLLAIAVELDREIPIGELIGYIGEVGEKLPAPQKASLFEGGGGVADGGSGGSSKKIVVIGGGPGGYVCAIKLAQLGASVTLVEKDSLGGTCLNAGCIPTKVLVHTAELFQEMKHAHTFGLKLENLSVDWKALMARKSGVISQLAGGVGALLRSNGVKVIKGEARFLSANEIVAGDEKISGEAFVIATGSESLIPPISGLSRIGDPILTSTEALSLTELPESIAIIGGGVIGIEFADVFSTLGAKVTVVEMLPNILPPVDDEISQILKIKMERAGVKFLASSKVTAFRESVDGVVTSVESPDGQMSFTTEKILLSVGRKPRVPLGLDSLFVLKGGKIPVNEFQETPVPGIYAIGDCSSPIMLAHVASAEGEIAAENIMHGNKKSIDYKTVPSCVYTNPEIAGVGMTEKGAKDNGRDVKIGRFPLAANGKSIIMNSTDGMIKFVVDKKHDEILGVHIIGKHATDLIVEGALALRLEATVEEIVSTIHAHPTVGEALAEAARAAR